jgi:GTPase KRas protein
MTTANPAGLEYKLVVLGGGGVGKSALTIRLVTDNFLDEYDPTIEDSYRKQVIIDDIPAVMDILDTAGQEEFLSMQDSWIRDGKGFLLVYNITSRSTFDEVPPVYDKILKSKDSGEKTPIVLVGNKCDLSEKREVETNEGVDLAKKWGCPFFETSAKLKINNESCFFELVRQIRKQEQDTKTKRKKGKAGGGINIHCIIL